MTDADWIKKVRKIKDPMLMLKTIVENERYFGYDSYYSDLRSAMLETAAEIVAKCKT